MATRKATDTNDREHDQPYEKAKRVDISEYFKSGTKKLLFTSGVATCTGINVSLPNRFSYLAHLSPLDEIYEYSSPFSIDVAVQTQDVLGQMLAIINWFDIKPAERRELRFGIMAPHTRSLKKTIRKLMDNGIYLAQIKATVYDDAVSVEMWADEKKGNFFGYWTGQDGVSLGKTLSSDLPSLAQLIKVEKH